MNAILTSLVARTGCPQSRASRGTAPMPRAFTVTELLVVITLIVILVLIAVPSFSAMVYSSEEALAESQMRAALRAARDAAVRSSSGNDGAAVFMFEPGGRLTIVPCVKVGELNDWQEPPASRPLVRREVFAAAPGFSAVSMPKYWMVRGFAPANSTTGYWYGQSAATPTPHDQNAWVFPETGFYNVDGTDDGMRRSTFMVRFQAGTGNLVGATTEPALVLMPRASSAGRTGDPYGRLRVDREEDPARFVRTVLSEKMSVSAANFKRQLIGRASSDMVMARPVMQLAVYNETKMGAAFGVRLDSTTLSVYAGPTFNGAGDPDYAAYEPRYVTGGSQPLTLDRIRDYIEGDTNLDGTVGDLASGDQPEARLYTVDRYTGALRKMEVQP